MKAIQCYEGEGRLPVVKLTGRRLAGKRGRIQVNGCFVQYRFGMTAPHAGNLDYLDWTYRVIPGNRYTTGMGCVMCDGKKRRKKGEYNLVPAEKFMNATRTKFRDGINRDDVIEMLTPHIRSRP